MPFLNLTIGHVPKVAVQRLLPLAVLTGLSVVGAALSYVYGLKPAENQLRAVEQVYQTAKQVQTDLQRTKTQQMRAQVAQRQLEAAWQALPTQEDFMSLALALSELAKREQVKIPGMGYAIDKPDGTQPAKATITFKATGDYVAIYRFLSRLETAESYLVIESLDVASEQKRDAVAARVVVNITVATYLRREAV